MSYQGFDIEPGTEQKKSKVICKNTTNKIMPSLSTAILLFSEYLLQLFFSNMSLTYWVNRQKIFERPEIL